MNEDKSKIVKTSIFSEEAIKNIMALGEVLRRIHNRLIAEGYVFKGGKFIKPNPKNK